MFLTFFNDDEFVCINARAIAAIHELGDSLTIINFKGKTETYDYVTNVAWQKKPQLAYWMNVDTGLQHELETK